MSKLTNLLVCNRKTGEKFIAGQDEITWNNGGNCTVWMVQQPINHQRIISGSANDDLMIIRVTTLADLPVFTIGDKVVIAEGKNFRLVNKFFSADFQPIKYNATVALEGFRYDSLDEEWYYIVMEVNPGMNPQLWEVKEKDVKRY